MIHAMKPEVGNRGDVHQPVEDCSTSIRDIEIGEEGKSPGEENGDVGNATFVEIVGNAEELWCLIAQSHGVEDPESGIEERYPIDLCVSGAPHTRARLGHDVQRVHTVDQRDSPLYTCERCAPVRDICPAA
jgi:hypothetical protein